MYVRKKILFSSFLIFLNDLSFAMDGGSHQNNDGKNSVVSTTLNRRNVDEFNSYFETHITEIEEVLQRLEKNFLPSRIEDTGDTDDSEERFRSLLGDDDIGYLDGVIRQLFRYICCGYPFDSFNAGSENDPYYKYYSSSIKIKSDNKHYTAPHALSQLRRITMILIAALQKEKDGGSNDLRRRTIEAFRRNVDPRNEISIQLFRNILYGLVARL